MATSDDRPDPEQLLARVMADEAKESRGTLKVFFGFAPGVGKTYTMLEAGRKLAKEGVDVLVGYIEPHARPETQSLVLGLDVLERRAVNYRGAQLLEFDLEAALRRKPQLILVDELAHTNAPGAIHAKRWQDVEQLLNAGIDVYTTLNVQHLDSLNDVIARVTSTPVRETVPDQVFERADEVELVDLAPDDLIERLREGKVYMPEQAHRAIENFFRKGNLIALRELALRKTAERVGEQAIDYRQAHDVTTVWPTSERLLVCVGSSPLSARLVRAARRMAMSLRAPWTAVHVEVERAPLLGPEARERLEQNLRLAEQLGARVSTVSGGDFAGALLHFAREHNISRIIIGKPRESRWRELWRGSYVYDLIRRSDDIDVYVISGEEEHALPRPMRAKAPRDTALRYLWSALVVAACTLIGFSAFQNVSPTNLAMVYLACVVGVALLWGRGPSIVASMLSVAAFDFFFVPPFGTFAVADAEYLFTFAVMLATGVVISELTHRVRAQSRAAHNRQQRTEALYDLSRELAAVPTRVGVVEAARRLISDALDADVWLLFPDESGKVSASPTAEQPLPPAKDEGIAQWVFDHREAAGLGADTLPGGEALYLPLSVTGGIVGVLGIRPHDSARPMETAQRQLLDAFTGQVALAIERCDLAQQAEAIRVQIETERLRNALLSSVSHDLRTPLTTITTAASMLLEADQRLSPEACRELAESIGDEAERLNRLVANLLDLTRLEAAALRPKLELQPIEESIGVALRRLERQLRNHPVELDLADDLPPLTLDGLLMQQLFINLLDNAAKFSPSRSPIRLAARVDEGVMVIEVLDRGPGLQPGEELRVFERFYRSQTNRSAGSGIGLAVCRGIAELHGGRIMAENRPGGGAVFRVLIPISAPGPNSVAHR